MYCIALQVVSNAGSWDKVMYFSKLLMVIDDCLEYERAEDINVLLKLSCAVYDSLYVTVVSSYLHISLTISYR